MIEKIPYIPFDGDENVVIVKAAVKCGDDVYVGWRHAFIMAELVAINVITKQNKMTDEIQGFVDNKGHFINRQISKDIVLFNRQISETKYSTLCSEDLWDNEGKKYGDDT